MCKKSYRRMKHGCYQVNSDHKNKGKSIQKCLKDRTDYAQNGEKTNDGELVSSYECDPKLVEEQFALSKREYIQRTGRGT